MAYSRIAVNMTGEWETKYNKRCNVALFCIKCPCKISDKTSKNLSEELWICQKCKNYLDYGFDDKLYCGCGRSLCKNFNFDCGRNNHGFIAIESAIINKYLSNLMPKPVYNICILGETGVGKSTWINSIANYMTFRTLKEAKDSDKIISIINSKFTYVDMNFKEIISDIQNEGSNEVLKVGQSSTQSPGSYVFEQPECHFRFIDTPGINDTRGREYDKESFAAILATILRLDYIHGICILLNPNTARLTDMFEYCIKELLINLHKNASTNIVFCFTNTRSTFYRPGDTYTALKQLLANCEEVQIKLNKDTVFCYDNEALRYLCARKQGLKFSNDEFKDFEKSWEFSNEETKRFFNYIILLEPHNLKETLYLNETKEMIVKLSRPLADTVTNINDNMAALNDKTVDLLKFTQLNDEQTQKRLQKASSEEDKIKILVSSLNKKIETMKKEQKIIAECSAKFRVFVLKNSIFPKNDFMIQYLDSLIDKQSGYAEISKNYSFLNDLNGLKKDYMKKVEILQTHAEASTVEAEKQYEEIIKLVYQLCNLEIYGKTIRMLFSMVQAGIFMHLFEEEIHFRSQIFF